MVISHVTSGYGDVCVNTLVFHKNKSESDGTMTALCSWYYNISSVLALNSTLFKPLYSGIP